MTVLPWKSFSAISFPFSSCKVNSGALSWMFMGMSPGKSKSNDAAGASRQLRFQKILYCRFPVALFLGIACRGIVWVGAAVSAPPAFAQEEIPQITVGERKATKKKDSGPRALAVMQLN